MTTKRSWKLQEYVAHSANIKCLALGKKSGRVLVTGGDDKKVNLWAVGKPNCIMSLSGHTTAVECVKFSHSEELVCAGSMSGALKIWDLEVAKLVRTLTGHKANIRCVDFHPYGEFLASGSMDTNIKLWDIRRKGCIFTYKGHNSPVNSLKFSPDGQWIASGGDDAAVRLWDLKAGKLLTEFDEHSNAVHDVEFHPHEFLLASGSVDRKVHFWDLENFTLVSSTEGDSNSIRCISFNADGDCLFTGSQDMLKIYGWEPGRTIDSVLTGWGKVQDIALAQNQLIGVSYQLTNVAIYVVDLKRTKPFSAFKDQIQEKSPFRPGQTVRKSFIKDKTRKLSKEDVKVEESDNGGTDPDDEVASIADIQSENDYQSIFHPRERSLRRTPPLKDPFPPPPIEEEPSLGLPTKDEPLSTRPESLNSPLEIRKSKVSSVLVSPIPNLSHQPEVISRENSSLKPGPIHQSRRLSESGPSGRLESPNCRSRSETRRENARESTTNQGISVNSSANRESDVKLPNVIQHSPSDPALNRQSVDETMLRKSDGTYQAKFDSPASYKPLDKSAFVRANPKTLDSLVHAESGLKYSGTVLQTNDDECVNIVPMQSDKPSGLDVEDFLPRRLQSGYNLHNQQVPELSESETFSLIMKEHENMMAILVGRHRTLQIVHSLWLSKDAKTAVEYAVNCNDKAVLVDLLSVINLRSSIWNLDVCKVLLPSIHDLIQSKFEIYMAAGCSALKLILRNFASVIKSNILSPIHTVGVDICREERYNKCRDCYNHLVSIRAFILKRQTLQGKLGHMFRELLILLQSLD